MALYNNFSLELKKKTLADLARENPTFTFNLFYDVWESPNSTEKTQKQIRGLTPDELSQMYGDFLFDSWYITRREPDEADVWAIANEKSFIFDDPCKIERNVDPETPMSINDGIVRVDWVNLGEGLSGDYNPQDPEDENLLRFDVYVMNNEGEWEEVEDASYCTMVSALASDADLEHTIRTIHSAYRNEISGYPFDFPVKKLGESLSWISAEPALENVGKEMDV